MAYPTSTTIRSYGGAVPPTYITTDVPNSYIVNQSITVASLAGWYEISATGQTTTNPLGTSGPFVIILNPGEINEEHILCSSLNMSTSTIAVWTDGTNNGRGYDGNIISAHYHQTTQNKTNDVFHGASATESLQFNEGVIYAVNTANSALSYVQGFVGLQGPQGIQGTQGYQGYQGAQGFQGSQGVQGATPTTYVSTFSGDGTGLLPSTATSGAVALSGTLNVANGGTGVTTSTGTGSTVLSTSPTLVTPALGAATATSLAATGEVSGTDLKATGLTGATAGNTRIVGSTTSGSPTSGTFAVGDVSAETKVTDLSAFVKASDYSATLTAVDYIGVFSGTSSL
jgi:hypothetical protein